VEVLGAGGNTSTKLSPFSGGAGHKTSTLGSSLKVKGKVVPVL
jgi:hypothetical protein